ncbi:MAG: hypothetical protein KDC53_12075 [Saprospiraceae bacterium]|nr:hypothetical protein [Saprospiraceae bacterium]
MSVVRGQDPAARCIGLAMCQDSGAVLPGVRHSGLQFLPFPVLAFYPPDGLLYGWCSVSKFQFPVVKRSGRAISPFHLYSFPTDDRRFTI